MIDNALITGNSYRHRGKIMARLTSAERLKILEAEEKQVLEKIAAKKKELLEAQKAAEKKLKEKLSALTAQKKTIETKEAKARRKSETQMKIILGGLLLNQLSGSTVDEKLKKTILDGLKSNERAMKNPAVVELVSSLSGKSESGS